MRKPRQKNVTDLVSIDEISNDAIATIHCQDKEYDIRMLSISGIDIFSYSNHDQQMCYSNFATATKNLKYPCKYVFTSAYPNLSEQRQFIMHKSAQASGISKSILSEECRIIENLQAEHKDRHVYVIVYAPPDERDNLTKQCTRYANSMADLSVTVCDKHTVISVLARLAACDDSVQINSYSSDYSSCIFSNDITLSESSFQIMNKTVVPIVVYEYPTSLPALAFANIFTRLAENNAMVTLDVSHTNQDQMLFNIKRSLSELSSRSQINIDYSDQIDTQTELGSIEQLYADIAHGSEQILSTTLRVYVWGDNETQLRDNIDNTKSIFENIGIRTFSPTNEMLSEYLRLITPADTVGNPIPCEQTFSVQFPFYYQSLIDPHGIIIGQTETGGIAAPDFFRKTGDRTSYDLLLLGVKGSGKTVALLKLVQQHIIRGHRAMLLDVEGQFHDFAAVMGGNVIRINRNSTINPLEMRVSYIQDNDTVYISELSRIVTFMYQYIPELSDIEAELFKDLLVATYSKFNISEETNIAQLQPSNFPTFKNVLHTLRQKLYDTDGCIQSSLTQRKIELYERIELYLKQLSEGMYETMFCGKSNVHLGNQDLIIFDVNALSEMDDRVFNAQLFNILSLMWSETCANIKYNTQICHPYDRRYIINVLDESHRFVQNNHVCNFIEKLLRRSRKYDAAFWFASQSIHEFNLNSSVIFGLVQYKILLKQSNEYVELLHEMFPQYTESEIRETPSFNAGDMLISISNRQKLRCAIEASPADLLYMGTSRDREQISINALHELYPNVTRSEAIATVTNDREYFISTFTNEFAEYLGYKRSDSEEFYLICERAVKQLCEAILAGGVSFEA